MTLSTPLYFTSFELFCYFRIVVEEFCENPSDNADTFKHDSFSLYNTVTLFLFAVVNFRVFVVEEIFAEISLRGSVKL